MAVDIFLDALDELFEVLEDSTTKLVPAQITFAANHAFPSSDKSLASLFDSSPT